MVLYQFRGHIIELTPLSGPRAWKRRGWLALVGGAHVLGFLCWQAPERPLAALAKVGEPITYILAPVRRPPPEPARMAPKAEPRVRQPVSVSAAPIAPVPEPIQAQPEPQAITQTAPPPDPFALPAKPEDDLKQRALKSAAAVDRQLRKEAWNPRDKKIANDTTALAAAFGKAYVGGGSGAMEEVTMADGTRMTKWRMPGGGTACFYKESNNFSGGRDPFRDSGRIKVMSCP